MHWRNLQTAWEAKKSANTVYEECEAYVMLPSKDSSWYTIFPFPEGIPNRRGLWVPAQTNLHYLVV